MKDTLPIKGNLVGPGGNEFGRFVNINDVIRTMARITNTKVSMMQILNDPNFKTITSYNQMKKLLCVGSKQSVLNLLK